MKAKIYTLLLALACAVAGASTMSAQAQWGTNLLQNTVPTTETQFSGWTPEGGIGGLNWRVEDGWFKSSNLEGVLYQTVNLLDKGFTTESLAQGTLYAAVRYAIPFPGTYQSGICQAMVVCIDEAGMAIDTAYVVNRTGYTNTEVTPSPAVILFNLPAGVAKLRYELHGRDQYGAAGRYGSCFTEMTMAIADNSATAYTASVSSSMGDSIVIDKMTGIKVGDTLTVRAKYAEHPVVNISANTGRVIVGNKIICLGADMVVSAKLAYQHSITADVQHGTVNVSPATAIAGDTITLGYTVGDGYFFEKYIVSPEVQWIDDHRFIMPDADVTIGWYLKQIHNVPFFEGFEENNAQGADIAGWWQESEKGTTTWQANSTLTNYNRTPYQGKWNATLTGSTYWMFAGIRLEAGKRYQFSMYARQDSKVPQASLRVCLGTSADKDAMNMEVLPTTKVNNGDYQLLTTKFSVPADDTYYLGIRGYIYYPANYLSIDDISIHELVQHSITCVSSVDGTISVTPTVAYKGDTVRVDKSVPEGYVLSKLTITPAVEWIDDRHFIMPDEDVSINMEVGKVHSIPFYEGFENGNAQGRPVADWLQYSIVGDSLWTANADLTATPFGGKWNAILCKNNMNWLFIYLTLEAGKQYRLSMYAQQSNAATYGAYIEAHIGNKAVLDSMKIEVIPSDNYLTGKDYQLLYGTFSVAESGVYALGIKGYAAYSVSTLNIDDIRVTEVGTRNIQTADMEAGTVTPSKEKAQFGETVRLRRTMAEGEVFIRYTTDVAVEWVNDSCFVMPDADVTVGIEVLPMHTMPFYEGFEEGNIQGGQPVGWVQQSEKGTQAWQANTTGKTDNRTPYKGKWNVTLYKDNTDWLFTGVQLEADTEYEMWLYARQNFANLPYANIRIALGTGVVKDSMKIEVLPEMGITNGDYQMLYCRFSVPTSRKYILGIRGYNNRAFYLSIDDIHIQKRVAHPISTADTEYGTLTLSKTEAYMGDTVSVERAMNEGYYFRDYTTNTTVQWIDDKRFIMPGAAVTLGIDAVIPHTVPFFDGFETGNTQDEKVAGWATQNEDSRSSYYWQANSAYTNYNRTPYQGKWNAALYGFGGNNCWLFNALVLETGKEYVLAIRARQSMSNAEANIKACLGTDCNKDSMKICIMDKQTVVDGDYQLLLTRFSVKTTGNYVLGILGSTGSGSYYLSIDNISVVERTAQQYAVTPAIVECGAVRVSTNRVCAGDTIAVSRTMNNGYAFYRYTTTSVVKWITDSTFVMPDEDVTVGMDALQGNMLPFFDGFEEGNTAGQPIANWIIEGEGGDTRQWKASKNLPYEGIWSAYFRGWNNSSWMFNAVNLEAGKTYTVSLVARQEADNGSPEKQTIQVCLGSTANATAMTTTLVPTTVIEQGGYYQSVVGAFTVSETATYVLGICGHTGTAMSVEIDNIRVQEKDYTPYSVSVADSVYGSPVAEQSTATMGDTIAVGHTLDATYIFIGYTTDIPVLWIDRTHFIMPDANVTISLKAAKAKSIPFFEGFEESNTQGAVVAGWLQFDEKGTEPWKANSTETQYNQTPYQGSWNAVLKYGNTDWLCQSFTLEKGKAYKVSLYARQDKSYKSYANISIYLGTEMSRESMTTEILRATGVANGDYQRIETTFAVQATAAYALGIRGYIGSSSYRLSIDNISIEEVPVVEVTPVVSATTLDLPNADDAAIRKALAALTLTAVDAKDSVVCTFANKADLWTIDWTLKEAAYSLLSSDLPAGYAFANDVETIRVALQNIGTGVYNAAASALQVYPNPAVDKVSVTGAADAITIYDLAGHVVLRVPAEGNVTTVYVGMLPAGVYMVRSDGKTVPMMVQ